MNEATKNVLKEFYMQICFEKQIIFSEEEFEMFYNNFNINNLAKSYVG